MRKKINFPKWMNVFRQYQRSFYQILWIFSVNFEYNLNDQMHKIALQSLILDYLPRKNLFHSHSISTISNSTQKLEQMKKKEELNRSERLVLLQFSSGNCSLIGFILFFFHFIVNRTNTDINRFNCYIIT